MKKLSPYSFAVLFFFSCTKNIDSFVPPVDFVNTVNGAGFTNYTINAGNHFCQGNNYMAIELSVMKFSVQFDSTAIYTTKSPANQNDINKLWGFSDNDANHHQYSARFGWRWSNEKLRLFAYVYNEGRVSSKELATAIIGKVIKCSIEATSVSYIFSVNGEQTLMPRLANTTNAIGYQLYPYFGGDEVAPHDVNIWVRSEP